MEPTTFDVVFPLTVLALLGVAVPSFMVAANWFLNRQRKTWDSKVDSYECGLSSTAGGAQDRFSVKFYLIAMIFLAFDIEVAFLYPWAVRFLKGGWDLFWILLAFLVMLESVYMYLWRKGALDWD
jgi:NADH-quinone oxidoreductase subunit A